MDIQYLVFSYSMWFSYQVFKVLQFIQWQFWPSCVGGAHPGEDKAFLFCCDDRWQMLAMIGILPTVS